MEPRADVTAALSAIDSSRSEAAGRAVCRELYAAVVKEILTGGCQLSEHVKDSLTRTEIDMILHRRRLTLRCTFCGKTADQVSRLIAGAKGYICDTCVGICNKILEATPRAATGNAMTDDQLLGSLAPCMASVEATRQVLQSQVETLRERGVSWDSIGKALGISRQAAWERFS